MAVEDSARVHGDVSWGVEPSDVAQKALGGSGELICQRNGCLVARHTRKRFGQPKADTEGGPPVLSHHVRVPRDDALGFRAKLGGHSTGSWAGLTGNQTA